MSVKGDYIICRCEDVTLREIQHVMEQIDSATPDEIKRRARVGMGWCQGRVCGPALAQITGDSPLSRSSIVRPVSLDDIAAAESVDDAPDAIVPRIVEDLR